jgi:outer membrane receptor protein involved in Fe transport
MTEGAFAMGRSWALAAAVATALGGAAHAEDLRRFDIPRQDLAGALELFGKQSGAEIVFDVRQARGRVSAPVAGQLEPGKALDQLLKDSGLVVQRVNERTFVVRRPASAEAPQGPETVVDAPVELSEVVVTVQKRTERALDVPASVSVVGERQLQNLHASSLQDYAAYVPGLIVDSGGSPGQATITMRGLNAPGDTTMVATYVDEAPLGSSNGYSAEASTSFDMMPYDLERVEVLRGPQGTLYGANSMGGLLKYVTKAPDLNAFETRVGGEVNATKGGSELGYAGRVGLNVPLVEGQLALRASLYRQETPGYIDNYVTGRKDQNALTQEGGRLALLWKPSEDTSLKVSLISQKIVSDDSATVRIGIDGRMPLGPIGGDLTNANPLREPFRKDVLFLTSTFTWDLGWAELTAASGFSRSRLASQLDTSATFGAALPGLSDPPVDPGLSMVDSRARLRRFTQEVRLASAPGPLQWMVGVYFDDERTFSTQQLTAQDAVTRAFIPGVNPLMQGDLKSTYREAAIFANLTYKLSDVFDVTGGVRWARNKQSLDQFASGTTPLLAPNPGAAHGGSSDDVFTYAVSPRYHFNKSLMLYGRIASGYRPGGPNPILPGVQSQVDADTTLNYELGLKGDMFDRRLQLDIAAFRVEWSDIQLEVQNEQNLTYATNGGAARAQGVEFASVYTPVRGLLLGFNTAYTDAVLTEDVPKQGWLDGARLPSSPKWTASFTANYEFPVGDDWTVRMGGGVRYVGKRLNHVEGTGDTLTLSSYSVVDLNAGLSNDRWTLAVFVRNLADKRVYANGGYIGFEEPEFINGVVLQPRTIGVSLDARF